MKYNAYHPNEKIERDIGAGRLFKLHLKDRFLMLLVYYRLYITYTLAGFLFDLDQSNVCRDIQKIEGLIRQCVPIPQKIYNKTKRLQTLEEVEKYFPGFLVFIDSTEQQIPRPVDKERRKMYYSGKKKRHTVKITRRKRIQHYSFKKEDNSGTYYQQIEKVQDTCRCI